MADRPEEKRPDAPEGKGLPAPESLARKEPAKSLKPQPDEKNEVDEDTTTEVDPARRLRPLKTVSKKDDADEDSTTEVDPIRKLRPPTPEETRREEIDPLGPDDVTLPPPTGKTSDEKRPRPLELDDPDANVEEAGDTRQDSPKEAQPAKKEAEVYRTVKAGTNFGRFQLLMEMAQGGMATLYLARIQGPKKFEKLVAIKKIHNHLAREQEFINMFLDEARIAALIHHPNVATIFDMGKIEDSYYIAMEYVHGQSLTDILRSSVRQRQVFPWTHAVRIVAEAAAGLHAAHELNSADGDPLNVVHRDVSPQNILISYDGHVKVVDFGVAYAAEKLAQTAVGTVKGKAAYLSPEQTRGQKADRRSDVFSLGTVLWESTCVRRLFREKNEASTLLKVRRAEIPKPRSIRPRIPVGLERIILKALSRKKEDRFETAGEMAEQLQELLVSKGEAVGPQKLARTMSRLFHDRKKIKDKQIKQALQRDPSDGVDGVAMVDSTGTSLDLPQVDSAELKIRPRKRSRAMTLTAGAVFAAGAIILAVALLFRPGSSTSREERPPAEREGSPNPRDARKGMDTGSKKRGTVILAVKVKPVTAASQVTFRGKNYKGTTFKVVVPRSKKPETLQVQARGYHSQSLVMVPVEDSEVTVTLKPKRKLWHKPRGRKPKPRKLLRDLPL